MAGATCGIYAPLDHGHRFHSAKATAVATRIAAESVEAAYVRIKEVKERVLLPYSVPPIEDLRIIGCQAHQDILTMVLEKKKLAGSDSFPE